LLISAGVHLEEICHGLAKAANTREARMCFTRMGKYVREGREIDEAASSARFPLYVVNPVTAAQRSSTLVEGTRDLSAKLIIDLEEFTNKATNWIQVGMYVLIAGFVMLFASLTVIPMLSAIFSAV
jgi:type II secretory pathway component PulF